ncbi:MAG: hypothetical protein AAFQ80_20225 [Cyanobacteria bacterium J06621_8]
MEPLGFWEWFGLMFLFAIPILNIIVFLAGALGMGKQGFVNYCRAFLLWVAIGVSIALVIGAVYG